MLLRAVTKFYEECTDVGAHLPRWQRPQELNVARRVGVVERVFAVAILLSLQAGLRRKAGVVGGRLGV